MSRTPGREAPAHRRPTRRLALAIGITGALVVAVAASGRASDGPRAVSEPAFRAEVPPTWRPLPDLAEHARAAATEAADHERLVLESRAWGDPSTGGFALVQHARMPSGGSARELHEALETALGNEAFTIGDHEFQDRDSRAESTFSFESSSLRGRARVTSTRNPDGLVRAVAAACFYNEREPERSAQQCDRFLSTFTALP